MYGDQFGEFVCGYWGLKVNNLQFDEMMYIVPACPEKNILWSHSSMAITT